jgi:hypothetical protein
LVGHEWLADQFKARDSEMEANALLKCRLCYSAPGDTLFLTTFQEISALQPDPGP